MKVAELKKLSVDELRKNLLASREDLMNLRFRHATAQLEKTADIPATRREIARILTILKEKGA